MEGWRVLGSRQMVHAAAALQTAGAAHAAAAAAGVPRLAGAAAPGTGARRLSPPGCRRCSGCTAHPQARSKRSCSLRRARRTRSAAAPPCRSSPAAAHRSCGRRRGRQGVGGTV